MRYKDFFDEVGGKEIAVDAEYLDHATFGVEEFYQHFKSRLVDEWGGDQLNPKGGLMQAQVEYPKEANKLPSSFALSRGT